MNPFLERRIQGTGRQLIGISGTLSSGKDALSDHLTKEHEFMHVSTGDVLRAIARRLYNVETPDRDLLIKTGADLRAENGPGVLVQRAIEAYKPKHDWFRGGLIVSGLRALGEAAEIPAQTGRLVYVDAPVEIRYERYVTRGRADNVPDLGIFQQQERRELEGHVPGGPHLLAVQAMADVYLDNSGSFDDYMVEAHDKLNIPIY